jgi:carbon-monoxide dehydrogenase small subunit
VNQNGRLMEIECVVNGASERRQVDARLLLSDFLRHELALTGTHVGCEHGVCGACTVLVDGRAVRSCLMFAVEANGTRIETVEGLAREGQSMSSLQKAFHEQHGLQCGFCTPGILMSLTALVQQNPKASREAVVMTLDGHLCRCTGYRNIVKAAEAAVKAGG